MLLKFPRTQSLLAFFNNLRYISHTMQSTHLKCIRWCIFRVFMDCTAITTINFGIFWFPPKQTPYPLAVPPHPPSSSRTPATPHLLSVSVDVPIRSSTMCEVLVCLPSFTYSVVLFRVHPRGSVCQCIVSFCGRIRYHCTDGPHFIYLVISWWTFRLLPLFGY